jgi:hypothetical protein
MSGRFPWETHLDRGEHLDGFQRPSLATDVLYDTTNQVKRIEHPADPWRLRHPDTPKVHLATIGSANTLLKDARRRDWLRDEHHVRAIEMEGSGIADGSWAVERPYIVIRGICDYCDTHKNDDWQKYAALVAAAYARALIENLPYYSPRPPSAVQPFAGTGLGSPLGSAPAAGSVPLFEFKQLRSELGAAWADKLESIKAMRGRGDVDGAWEALSAELASLAGSLTPEAVQARYYYHAARWAQEDGRTTDQAARFHQAALRLDPELDDRTYRAFQEAADHRVDNAIAILLPLDSEPVVIGLLKYLRDSDRGSEAEEFMARLETPVTDEIRRFHSLCRLAAGDPDGAWQALEPALPRRSDHFLFQLTAGYVSFWRALPAAFHVPPSANMREKPASSQSTVGAVRS